MCRSKEIVSSLVLRRDEKKTLRDIKEKQGRVLCKKGVEGEACYDAYFSVFNYTKHL